MTTELNPNNFVPQNKKFTFLPEDVNKQAKIQHCPICGKTLSSTMTILTKDNFGRYHLVHGNCINMQNKPI